MFSIIAYISTTNNNYNYKGNNMNTLTNLNEKLFTELYQFSKVTGDLVNIDCRYTTISVL
jgi:hypothetical protein